MHFKPIKPPFSGHTEEPRTFHCVMLCSLLLSLYWAGSLATEDYHLSVTSPMTVQEGLCIFVPCQVHYPTSTSSVFGYWFQYVHFSNSHILVATNNPSRSVQKETQGRFHLMGPPSSHNCSLEIRDAKRTDTQEYFFRVDNDRSVKYNFMKQKLSVQVIALTDTPKLQVIPTLVSGTSTQLICSLPWACEKGTPPIFSWMSSALTSLGPRTTLSSELNLIPRPQDHGTNITCQVTFPGVDVTVEKTEQLSVTYAPQKLTIRASWGDDTEPEVLHSGSSLHVQEGESLHLVCVADSNPPAMLSWAHQTQKHFQLSNGELQLQKVELKDQGKYICRAQNNLGAQVASVSLSIRNTLETSSGVVQGALWGAGFMALLAVCLYFIFFIVKVFRKKSALKVVSIEGNHPAETPVSTINGPSMTSSSVLGHLTASEPQNQKEQPLAATVRHALEDEPELHYASLSFQGLKPRQPQNKEAIKSDYMEIKIHKC